MQVFDYLDNVDFRSLIPSLTDLEIRYYLFELLKVLLERRRHWIIAIARASCIVTSSRKTSSSIHIKRS